MQKCALLCCRCHREYHVGLMEKGKIEKIWQDKWAEIRRCSTTVCGEKFATPPVERREKVAEVINRFGVACVLQEIVEILRQGRNAEHEQALITELDNARTKFIVGDKALMDARIVEKYGTDE